MFGIKKKYEIEYWYYTAWGYDNEYVDIIAYDETQAIQLARQGSCLMRRHLGASGGMNKGHLQ